MIKTKYLVNKTATRWIGLTIRIEETSEQEQRTDGEVFEMFSQYTSDDI